MRKCLIASAVALAALAVPSFAANVTIDGTIALKCTLAISHATLPLGDIATNDAGRHLGGLANASTFLDGTAMCNGTANTVDVVAVPLTTVATGSGFTNRIDYTLTVGSLVPGSVVLSTSSGTLSGTTSHQTGVGAFANASSSGASLLTEGTALPVMAGDYSGTVTVTLTAG